jgi:nucleotide-binding universal stress UspA family protein
LIDGALMTRWFTPNDSLFWGTNGDISEETLGSARRYFGDLLPKNATGTGNKFRTDAQVHLIVLGRKNRNVLSRFVFGSVTKDVVETSPYPVIVVPEHDHHRARRKEEGLSK